MNLRSCPICKQALAIREYHCPKCEISFKGDFSPSWTENLSNTQMEFVRLFLIVQGNIKEMEKRLGISYPTVKNRLGEIVRLITLQNEKADDFSDVFNDLEEGFINVDEAINLIETRRNK